jgi:hypothetical protein
MAMANSRFRKVLGGLMQHYWLPGMMYILLTTSTYAENNHKESLTDAKIDAFQGKLLDIAFQSASLIPVNPHIKDRSKAQEAVVKSCLQLKQAATAAAYSEKVVNWRRGTCFTELALYCAKNCQATMARHYLRLAEDVAAKEQDWRKDRINEQIMRCRLSFEELIRAESPEDLPDIAPEKANLLRIVHSSRESLADNLEVLFARLDSQNFDIQKEAIEVCLELYNRFYSELEWRTKIENRIRIAWEKLPVHFRIDWLLNLSETAFSYADSSTALSFMKEAEEMLTAHSWNPQVGIPLIARIARQYFNAGETGKAKTELGKAFETYQTEQNKILDIDRATTLRPIAEAYQVIGDSTTALKIYRMALEEGDQNPNSRPRAEDLSSTCLSMVLSKTEPDEVMWRRIHQIHNGLRAPW